MDCENDGSDSMDREDLLEEEVPKILHQAIRDVFPIFANMLNIKSFMRLSMTNKEMHKFCMENKEINIKIKESTFSFEHSLERCEISLETYRRPREQYYAFMRRNRCSITLEKLTFRESYRWSRNRRDIFPRAICPYRSILEEIGVKKIDQIEVDLGNVDWDEIISVVENFHVQKLDVKYYDVPMDILRSLLQLKVNYFRCLSEVPAQLLLDVDSPISHLNLPEVTNCSREVFLPLLWKIQTGPVVSLLMNPGTVNWKVYHTLNYEYDGPLPDDRPLVFRRWTDSWGVKLEFWFLLWHGGVTKCSEDREEFYVCKCSPEQLPPVLKSQEQVHDLLTQKRNTDCLVSHFRNFFAGRKVYELSAEDPIPEERPLLLKEKEDSYWLINEDDTITTYQWSEFRASSDDYDMKRKWPSCCFNKALGKKIFRNMLQSDGSSCPWYCFFASQDFFGLFNDFPILPFDFWDTLPAERPLIFEQGTSELDRFITDRRFILHVDGGVTQCDWRGDIEDHQVARFTECTLKEIPSALISSKLLKNRLLKERIFEEIIHLMELQTLQGAFDEIATLPFDYSGPLPEDRPLFFKNSEITDGILLSEEYWLLMKSRVTRCKWESGRTIVSVADPQSSPKALVKGLALEYLQRKWKFEEKSFFNKDTFLIALREFDTFPFDSIGTLPTARPLVFQPEDSPFGKKNPPVALLDGESVVICNFEGEMLVIDHCPPCDLPSALITVEYLKIILWNGPSAERDYHFNISLEMFLEMFKEYKTLPYDYNGPLPEHRPVVFEWSGDGCDDILYEERWFYSSNTVTMCSWGDGHVRISKGDGTDLPSTLQKLYIRDYIENSLRYVSRNSFDKETLRDCLNAMKIFSSSFRGPLPDDRPLVFQHSPDSNQPWIVVILMEDGRLMEYDLSSGSVAKCNPLRIPEVLITAEHFSQIAMKSAHERLEYDGLTMSLEVFFGGLDAFPTFPFDFSDPLPNERPVVFKSEKAGAEEGEERWLLLNNIGVTRCLWKDGKALLTNGSHRDFPIAVTKEIFKQYLQEDELRPESSLFLDFNSLRSCLQNFKTLPYDYSGPLPEERPLIFEKSEIQHECGGLDQGGCNCSERTLLFWIVREDEDTYYRFDYATWNEEETNRLEFLNDLFEKFPPAIVSRDFLKNLLERPWLRDNKMEIKWFGEFEDFLACFEGYTTLEWNEDMYEDPRKRERPLAFKERVGDDQAVFWFQNARRNTIKCSYSDGAALLLIEPRDVHSPFFMLF